MTDDEFRQVVAEMLRGVARVLMEGASRISLDTTNRPEEAVDLVAQPHSRASPDEVLKALKKTTHSSWTMLSKGLRDLAGLPVEHSTENVANSSRSFARRAVAATGLSAEELLDLLAKKRWA
ncbi:hypothetical protein AA309_22720 [Microvirga vignae]|uniref:Uncharacterized protein n=1 Tax=Microvirga vignae TaxID=1225564 RepID=A0A0H1R6W3_9HYPH|nr:hypothetical protein [Microvirga vignae]KLK90995.1 hypothetical protein AA309_22720 [Microvirga vignae]